MSEPLLACDGLVAGFGANTVLHGVSFSVAPGEIAGIFGLNGAGKSVTMKVVAGVVPARDGTVRFEGQDITALPPEQRVARGIGNVSQGRHVFPGMTVEENLRVGATTLRRRDRSRYAPLLEQMFEQFPVLRRRRTTAAGSLSGGEQASLAVARALMGEPRLLLVDEPSAGLAPLIVEELFETLQQVRASGVTVLAVEQNVTFGLKLVDRAHIMQQGSIVYAGDTADLDRQRVSELLGIGRLGSLRAT